MKKNVQNGPLPKHLYLNKSHDFARNMLNEAWAADLLWKLTLVDSYDSPVVTVVVYFVKGVAWQKACTIFEDSASEQ